ncbi:unnamed protein product [Phytophthora lilii]|uniref:Unnamed protein product n=1 Tax=Phytophthora lilii TaxID=2077276 RepID=A0A9W7D974_9STRA|nr:unnamed protein product [Phytophthora lilii]
MAKGSRSAVPATPMKSGGTCGDDSNAALITPHLAPITERSVSFEDSADGSDAKDEMEDYEDLEKGASTRCGDARHSGRRDIVGGTQPSVASDFDIPGPSCEGNGDFLESDGPPGHVATFAVDSRELGAGGSRCRTLEMEEAPARSLRCNSIQHWTSADTSFGRETTDPSKVPLPKTPTKTAEDSRGRKAPTAVFSATGERSPYFQDSHMVTPKSVNRTEHVRTTADNSRETRRTNRSSGRGLERRLCHIRVKDIHELEEMIKDILKIDERNSTRESSQHHSRSRDSTRRREERRREDSRDHYSRRDRRDRDYDRRRDDSRNVPRVTLAEALVTDIFAELQERDVRSSRGERPRNTQRNIPNSGSEADSDEFSDDSRQLSDTRSDGYYSDGSGGGISLQPTTTKDERPPKVHTHVPITEDQGVTQRAETSAEMTAIQHEVIVKDVRGNTGLVPPAADSLIPPTTAVSGVNCANKCMTPADARSSKKLQTWSAAKLTRRIYLLSCRISSSPEHLN